MFGIRCINLDKLPGISDGVNVKEWKRTGKELVSALEEIGFVYIKNHGISHNLIQDIHQVCQSFFDLSLKEKKMYIKNDVYDNGYVDMSREIFQSDTYSQELRESFDILRKNNEFPSEVVGFKETVLDLLEEGENLFHKLLMCLEIGLDIPRGTLINEHTNLCSDSNNSALRLINYPPVPEFVTEGTVRCGTHSDYGTITLLFQDSMGGLEVKHRNGKWVKANPIPDTVLVNVGDMLQMMTSGKLVATEHRVLIPEEEIKRRCPRRSVAFFLNPNLDSVIKPLDGSSDFVPLTCEEYLTYRLRSTFAY